MLTYYLILAVIVLLTLSTAASSQYDPSTPLLLDDYLANATAVEEGRALSRVTSFPTVYSSDSPTTEAALPFTLHSGYFSVTPSCTLFFQLFSPNVAATAPFVPLVVFLAGGPGVAGSYWTLYGGVTPLTYTASPSPRLLYHNQSWAEDAHVLVVDSPISVGYSRCASSGGPTRAANNSDTTAHLTAFMHKFLTLFPSFVSQRIYIAGHSYGGRTAPDLAVALGPSVVSGVIVESGISEAYLSFSETCNAVYLQGLSNSTERRLCNEALDRVKQGIEAHDESATSRATSDAMRWLVKANSGHAYQDWQRNFGFADAYAQGMVGLLTNNDMRVALHAGSDTPYSMLTSYDYSDSMSGESLSSLDAVLSADSAGRVLYFASNKDSLIGFSTQRLLAASKYNARAGWDQHMPEALRLRGNSDIRGMLKRDARLWFATVYDGSHEMSVVMPALSRQLVADFILNASAAGSDESRPLPASRLEWRQKLLPRGSEQEHARPVPDVFAQDVSPAVYLTPYLEQADGPAMAQQAAAVTLPHSPVLAPNTTYAGYFTIDAALGSNSFFYFLPSLDKNASAPLILHLSGGPGISSMAMGFLYQHGAAQLDYDSSDPLSTVYRDDNYNEHNHMLYVDNPIGTGYSYTESPLGFRNDSRQVADDLYELLRQFYLLFPAYRSCRLYVHGVSYAGHFLPTLGYKIHSENMRRPAHEHMPLEGLFIASGYMDPAAEHAEEVGFFQAIGRMDLTHTDRLVGGNDDDLDSWNYVDRQYDDWSQHEARIMAYLSHPSVVSALHVGPGGLAVRSSNNSVTRALNNDAPVKPEVEALLASGYYQVVMYTAEYDVVCAAAGVHDFIYALEYVKKTEWMERAGKVWWPQPTRPASQSRQPPHTSPLQPWQPQEQGIQWSSAPGLTLHHGLIRFAGHLVEQTHLYQAGQILSLVQSWPTLPKSGGGGGESGGSSGEEPAHEESEGFFASGVGRAFIALVVLSIVVGAGAAWHIRKENREKAGTARQAASPSNALTTSLLGDEDKYGNSTL